MDNMPHVFEIVLTKPDMCLPVTNYDTAVSFILGANSACLCDCLEGFREWLMIKIGIDSNLMWTELVLALAFPNSESPRAELDNLTNHLPVLNFLHELLTEFWDVKKQGGLRLVFLKYEKWLRTQNWYNQTSPDWFDFDGV